MRIGNESVHLRKQISQLKLQYTILDPHGDLVDSSTIGTKEYLKGANPRTGTLVYFCSLLDANIDVLVTLKI